jgi:hypothetical protein
MAQQDPAMKPEGEEPKESVASIVMWIGGAVAIAIGMIFAFQ